MRGSHVLNHFVHYSVELFVRDAENMVRVLFADVDFAAAPGQSRFSVGMRVCIPVDRDRLRQGPLPAFDGRKVSVFLGALRFLFFGIMMY